MKVKILFLSLSVLIAFSYSFCDDWTISSDTWIPPGTYNYGNLTVNSNCTLVCKSATGLSTGPVYINCTNLTINSNGRISANGTGYPGNQGPGIIPTSSGNGGSYGGYGSDGNTADMVGPTYGSIKEPVDLGSGANPWSSYQINGGGCIIINVTNELKVDGILSSNGVSAVSNDMGGSGGSLNIRTKVLSGSGDITANGGRGLNPPADGGGGRIAIYYESNSFSGNILARRGTVSGVAHNGGAGTIFMKSSVQPNGDLIIDGGGYSSDSYYTPIAGSNTFDTILIKNLGGIEIPAGSILTTTYLTSNNPSNVIVWQGGTFNVGSYKLPGGDFVVDNFTLEVKNDTLTLNNLTIGSNGKITHRANYDTKQYWLNSVIEYNLTIEPGGSIDVIGRGFAPKFGTGGGTGTAYYGASYGGYGETVAGCTVGPTYGSAIEPLDLGSGGNSHAGGGSIYLQVWDTLKNDGLITAEGALGNSSYGVGSGGSVYIRTSNFNGSGIGKISVKGGYVGNPGWLGANGGGGRIAVYYYYKNYTGSYDTGGGGRTAQPGTLYLSQTDFHLPPRTVSIDNPAYSSPISGKRPSFKWTAPTDVENDVLQFDVEITQDSSFAVTPAVSASSDVSQAGFQYSSDSGITWSSFPAAGISSSAVPALKVMFTVQQDLWVGNWYWRVRARDNDGNGNWSVGGELPSIIADLVVRITSPDDSIAVYVDKVNVEGTIEQSVYQSININGDSTALSLTDNKFSKEAVLNVGKNVITATGYGVLGNYISDTVTVCRLRVPMAEAEEKIGTNGGTVRLDDYDGDESNDARLEIGAGAVEKEVSIKMSKIEGDLPSYEIRADNQDSYKFKKRVRIVLSYKDMKVETKDEDRLTIFSSDNVKWHPIGSEVDKSRKLVSCYTNHLSRYTVMLVPESKNINVSVSPALFTPNRDGINDFATFYVTSASGGKVEIKIYDADGRNVREITEENVGKGISISWDGLDNNNKLVESGVYVYNVLINGKTITTGSVVSAK